MRTNHPRGSRAVPAMAVAGLSFLIAPISLSACGSEETTVTAAASLGWNVDIDGVVDCLTGQGWTEVGKSTGTSGTAYTVDSQAGTSALLSTNTAEDAVITDSTTYTIPAPEPEGGSLNVEAFIGTMTDEERSQIEECAAG